MAFGYLFRMKLTQDIKQNLGKMMTNINWSLGWVTRIKQPNSRKQFSPNNTVVAQNEQ